MVTLRTPSTSIQYKEQKQKFNGQAIWMVSMQDLLVDSMWTGIYRMFSNNKASQCGTMLFGKSRVLTHFSTQHLLNFQLVVFFSLFVETLPILPEPRGC